MKQILYGVGESFFTDLKDPTKVLALSKLQNLTVNFSAESDEVHGGDDPYPITEFPKTRTITITAQDALFDINFLNITQGALTKEENEIEMTEGFTYNIPDDLKVELKHAPTEGSLGINGFKKADTTPTAAGEYAITGKEITFHADDKGKEITGIYTRKVTTVKNTVGFKDKFPIPFRFTHRIPIYNDENQIVQQAQLTIYKCKTDSNFEFNFQPQTAYAPQLTLKALDPKRPDGILWSFVTEEVEPELGEFGTIGG